ncbi:MAG: HAMP domain-containing protein [Nitrospirae bacterium]|nr:MAG: HAMP domain-containing protein [Nitrospirota bacterium]
MSSKDKTIVTGFLSRIPLQQKFILITSVAIVLLMSIIGYLVTMRERQIMYTDIERQGRVFAETLAIPVINDLIYERLGLVEEGGLIDNYIRDIFNKKELNLLYLAVLDEHGRVISHNDFSEYGKVYTDTLTQHALSANTTVVQKFHSKVTGHDALDFATPLSIGKKRWGTLKFAISLEEVEHEISNMVKRILFFTIVVLIVGFFIIIILSRRFIKPITYLARTMERAGSGDLDVKVHIKGNDELALLGQSFNNMIERIKQANLELKRTHEKLLQSEKLASIGILASGVAHEINNPLGGMFNCVDMLELMGDNEELRNKYLNLLKDGLNRIETIVGKLLWMSRTGSRNPEVVDVKAILQDIYKFVEYRLKNKGIKYTVQIQDGLTIIIDPHDFQQIMLNLIINAVHAMKSGGILTIKGFNDDGYKVITVSDTGEGIDKENLPKIFDPFFTTKQPGEGTGLGLWLTYEIVKNYNGEIMVDSEKGVGTTFTLKFRR